MNQILDS